MEEKTKKVLFHLINTKTKGVDIYHHDGSMWLIFTNEKRWVIELTKDGTLWYNYNFFQNCFKLMSLDVVENQHYITKWVEETIQNGVKHTWYPLEDADDAVEDTIQNGVRNTFALRATPTPLVEDTIQNGVRNTKALCFADDTIQNGVRKIEGKPHDYPHTVANIIKNGVKHTEYGDWEDGDERFNDIIKNGVKETKQEEHHRLREVVQTVKNGIKETRLEQNITEGEIDDIIQNGINETWGYEKQPQIRIDDVINKGEKTICNNNPNKL
jgi:hypothetical protein